MEYDTLILKCSESIMDLFTPELQKGFYIMSVEGRTLFEFLTEDCCLSRSYISEKIKTIFINGGPVDDIYHTCIREDEECALSGAMPGLVGAMMRIGSPYAPMRESITAKQEQVADSGREIRIMLKLFNVILSDTGRDFLYQGIILNKQRLYDFFIKNNHKINNCSMEILFNSMPIENVLLNAFVQAMKELVFLKIETVHENKS